MKLHHNGYFVFVILVLASCNEELVQHIDESRAHRVITELYTLGIEARKVKQGEGQWSVEVSSKDLSKAIAILTNRKLMPEGNSEQFAQPGIMDSKEEHQFAYQRKLGVSLEKTLETFPHLLRARVHIYIPPEIGVLAALGQAGDSEAQRKPQHGSASILVLADRDAEVTTAQIVGIVAGASGLPKESIEVVFEKVPQITIPMLPHTVTATQDTSFAAEKTTSTAETVSRTKGVIVWGTLTYLVGIVGLLAFLGRSLVKRYRMAAIGQRILYEGK